MTNELSTIIGLTIKPCKIKCWDTFCEEVFSFSGIPSGMKRITEEKDYQIRKGPLADTEIACFFHQHLLWPVFQATEFAHVKFPAKIVYQDASESQRSMVVQYMFQKKTAGEMIDILPVHLFSFGLENHPSLYNLCKVWQEIDDYINYQTCTAEQEIKKIQPIQDLLLKKSLISHLNIIYTQMVLAEDKYGVMSMYNYTWFLRRFPTENGKEELHISPPIFLNGTPETPRIIPCYSYLAFLADQLKMNVSQRAALEEFTYVSKSLNHLNKVDMLCPVHLEIEELKIGWLLHSNKTNSIYLAKYKGQVYLIKVSPISKQKMNPYIKHEIIAYETLRDLQGTYIPKMEFFGTWGRCFTIIAFEHTNGISADKCGRRLRIKEKAHIRRAIKEIHSRGIVHNDLSPKNLIVHSNDIMPLLIDFELSEVYDKGKVDDGWMAADGVDSLLKAL